MGRILAIGDVHGCHTALRTLISKMDPREQDTVVVLGDVVDRGPDSRGVIDQLIHLSTRVRLVGILGNHEEMLLDSVGLNYPRVSWLCCGGQATLDSYGGELEAIPDAHLELLRSFQDYWQSDKDIFVHASLAPGVSLEEQTFPWLRWSSLTGEETPHPSGKRVVCGHTELSGGVPAVLDGIVCIDTCCHRGRWLTCLDTTNDLVYQAAQDGACRGPIPLAEIAVAFTGDQ